LVVRRAFQDGPLNREGLLSPGFQPMAWGGFIAIATGSLVQIIGVAVAP
jgi:hypothetical protein